MTHGTEDRLCPGCRRTYTVTGGDFDPNWTMHPGAIWRDVIAHDGLTVSAAAAAIGVSRARLSNILAGRGLPTAQTTVAFARHFGIEPRFLWQLRANYELDLARGKQDVTRTERGSSDLGPIGAVLLTVLIIAVVRVLFDVDLIGYIDAAADWAANVLTELVNAIGDNR